MRYSTFNEDFYAGALSRIEQQQQIEMARLSRSHDRFMRGSYLDSPYDYSASAPAYESDFRGYANRMTMGKFVKYAVIGAAYGAAAVIGAAVLGAPVGFAALGFGAAAGAVTLPVARSISKTLGRSLVIAPPVIGAMAAFGVGNVISWGLLGLGTVGAVATMNGLTSMRPTPISTLPAFRHYRH